MTRCIPLLLTVVVFAACRGGNSEKQVNDTIRLADSLEAIIKKSGDSLPVRMGAVNALDSLHMYNKAIAHVDTLILKDSLNNELWLRKGQLHEDNGDTAEAIRSYKLAVRLYPSWQNQLYLANLLAENRQAEALRICANVVSMNMGREANAYADFIAGVFFARTGNAAKALPLFDRSIGENYTLMEAYMEKGFVLFERRDYSNAIRTFQRAITVNNQYADAYYWEAKCREAQGNREEALAGYQRALGLDKQLKEATAAIERLQK